MANETANLNTRGELATHIQAKLQQTTSNAKRAEILRDLDHCYRVALTRKPWPQLNRWVDTGISASGGVAYIFLPKDVRNIIGIQDATTPIAMQQFTAKNLFNQTNGFANLNGLAVEFARVADSATNAVLSAGTALEILSDGTDTRAGFIRGRYNNEQKTQAFTLTSAVAVSLGSWDEANLLEIASSSQSRTVTLRIVGGANVGAVAPNETVAAYQKFRVFPIPQNTVTLRVLYKYTPPQIFDENHQYVIPIQDYLMQKVMAMAYQADRKWAPAQAHMAEAEMIFASICTEIFGEEIEVATPLFTFGGRIAGGIIVNRHGE